MFLRGPWKSLQRENGGGIHAFFGVDQISGCVTMVVGFNRKLSMELSTGDANQ